MHMAVDIDDVLERKTMMKGYLLSAVVPVTTISKSLGLEQEDQEFTTGMTDAVCYRIIENMIRKIKFLQELPKSDHVVYLLNRKHQPIKVNGRLQKILTFLTLGSKLLFLPQKWFGNGLYDFMHNVIHRKHCKLCPMLSIE